MELKDIRTNGGPLESAESFIDGEIWLEMDILPENAEIAAINLYDICRWMATYPPEIVQYIETLRGEQEEDSNEPE